MASSTVDKKLRKLEAENDRLLKENAALKKLSGTSTARPRRPLKSLIALLCICFAAALLLVGTLLFWTGNTIVKTDRFVAATAPIIRDPAVQKALGNTISDRLFERVDIE